MNRKLSSVLIGISLDLTLRGAPAQACLEPPYRLALERARLDSSTSLDIRIYEPILHAKEPRLVIVAPGSDGAVQPEKDDTGNSDALHLLSEQLAKEGFTVVRYSNRGYRDPALCLIGVDVNRPDYVRHCVDQSARAKADFNAADEDFIAAWRWSRNYAERHGIERTAIIGVSEGMSHVAHVAAYARLATLPLIFIGGAQESQHDIVSWQLSDTFLLDRAAALIDRSEVGWVKDEDVARDALGNADDSSVKRINEVFRINYIDARRVKEARSEQKLIVSRLIEQLMETPAAFPQYAVRHDGTRHIAFNTGWLQQMLSDYVSSIDRLVGAGASNVTLLYGTLDSLMPVADYRARPCPFRCIYLEEVGHVLSDRSGKTMPSAVSAVVKALDDMWR